MTEIVADDDARTGTSHEIRAVVVAYWSASTIEDCLRRLLAATHVLEVVVIDNGSGRRLPSELETRIAQVQKSLDDLSLRYTDQHPDVQATRRLIEQLEEQRTTELEARRKATSKAGKPGRKAILGKPVEPDVGCSGTPRRIGPAAAGSGPLKGPQCTPVMLAKPISTAMRTR